MNSDCRAVFVQAKAESLNGLTRETADMIRGLLLSGSAEAWRHFATIRRCPAGERLALTKFWDVLVRAPRFLPDQFQAAKDIASAMTDRLLSQPDTREMIYRNFWDSGRCEWVAQCVGATSTEIYLFAHRTAHARGWPPEVVVEGLDRFVRSLVKNKVDRGTWRPYLVTYMSLARIDAWRKVYKQKKKLEEVRQTEESQSPRFPALSSLGDALACFKTLDADQQRLIRMRILEGRTCAEVAKALHCDKSTVSRRCREALKVLRGKVAQKGML